MYTLFWIYGFVINLKCDKILNFKRDEQFCIIYDISVT